MLILNSVLFDLRPLYKGQNRCPHSVPREGQEGRCDYGETCPRESNNEPQAACSSCNTFPGLKVLYVAETDVYVG